MTKHDKIRVRHVEWLSNGDLVIYVEKVVIKPPERIKIELVIESNADEAINRLREATPKLMAKRESFSTKLVAALSIIAFVALMVLLGLYGKP